MKFLYSICSFCFLTIVMGTQCNKDAPYDHPKQWFSEKITVTPAQKIYNVGDTVWLSFITPDKTLFDTISNQRLPSNSVKFRFGTVLLAKYDAPDNPTDGYCNFILPPNVSSDYYHTEKGRTNTSFYIGCDNAANYNVRVGIVFKYKGYYVFDMISTPIEPCTNQANPYPYSYIRFTFDVNDTNKDVYLAIPASFRNEYPVGITEQQLDSKAAFAFKVQ